MYIYCVSYLFHGNSYSAYFFADSIHSAWSSVENYIPSSSSVLSVRPLRGSDAFALIRERDNYLPPDSILRDLLDSYLLFLNEE